QFLDPAAYQAQGGLDGFSHHFADMAGENQRSFARIARRLDMQYFSAHWRVCQSGHNSWFADLQAVFAKVPGWAQDRTHDLGTHPHVLSSATSDFGGHRTANRTDLALQLPHPGFMGIVADDSLERRFLEGTLFRRQPVLLKLTVHQVFAGNLV